MKTEIKKDVYGRQWGYLLLTPAELETVKKNMTMGEAQEVLSASTWLLTDPSMIPHGYEPRGRKDRVFICVETNDEESIAVTFKQLENKLNA